MTKMPLLRPIHIPTKGQKWYKRIWTWFASSRKWELAEDYFFKFKDLILVVEKGFVFDGASIPRIFWSVLSPVGLLLIPGLFHDKGYKDGFIWQIIDGEKVKWQEGAGRSFWDHLFLDIGKAVNGVLFADYIAWAALKVGGFLAWRAYRNIDFSTPIPDANKLPPVEERGDVPHD